jgi:hypothetical protein
MEQLDPLCFDWSAVHDAVLVSVALEWRAGTADIVMKLQAPPARQLTIHAEGTSWLCCPREAPWGTSVHVNTASAASANDRQHTIVRVEMQSGDTLELRAQRIELFATAP